MIVLLKNTYLFLFHIRLKCLQIVELVGLVSPEEGKIKHYLLFQARTQTLLWRHTLSKFYEWQHVHTQTFD